MLQIRINYAQNLPPGRFPPGHNRSRQTPRTFSPYNPKMRILLGDFLSQLPAFIRAVVINKDYFEVDRVLLENCLYPLKQRADIGSFIKGWNHEGKHISPPGGIELEPPEKTAIPFDFISGIS